MFANVAPDAEGTWIWTAVGLISVPALVALNAFFVAAEFALVGVRRTRVEELVQRGVAGSKALQSAVEHLDRSIAATQLGITLASLALGWVGEPALAHLLDPLFVPLAGLWRGLTVHSLATGITFCLITFMHVVFGELIPKTVALQSRDHTALWVARPLNLFARLTRPIILLMNGTGNYILGLFGYKHADNIEEMVHSIEELALVIENTEEAGLLDEDQAEFVQNVFRLSNKKVRDCMVAVDKIGSLELNTPPEKVLEKVRFSAHTRMPVYDGMLDNIVGIVNTKDLFYLFSVKGVVILEDALYPALFLPPDEPIATALRLFKQAKRHMALVRDDDGKVLGLLTLEDILEEIVGDIEDEHDQPLPRFRTRMRRSSTFTKPPAPKK